MAEATQRREKQAVEFAAYKSDSEANIVAIAKAVDTRYRQPSPRVVSETLVCMDSGGYDDGSMCGIVIWESLLGKEVPR